MYAVGVCGIASKACVRRNIMTALQGMFILAVFAVSAMTKGTGVIGRLTPAAAGASMLFVYAYLRLFDAGESF